MAKDENRSLWRPFVNFPFFEDDFFNFESSQHSGLEVSEDDKNVFIEAHLPGLNPDDIEISFEKGMLFVKGAKKEEEKDKEKKYYRKASSSFSYSVKIPGNIDESQEPEATYNNGVLKVTFSKKEKGTSRKIQIKR